ncbi:MAG: hypothetical protein AAGA54_04885 [Myxococcota bacterium]
MSTRVRFTHCALAVVAFASMACDDGSSSGGSTDPTMTTAPTSATVGNSGSTGSDESETGNAQTTDVDPSTTTADPTDDTAPGSSTSDGADGGSSSDGGVIDCTYPANAVDPMVLDGVLWPYVWNTALHGDGTSALMDLSEAPCGDDANIAWSPHDVLVFVSIPAW